MAQQMVSVSCTTLLEMLGRTHHEIVSKRLLEIPQEAHGVSPPETDMMVNLGYEHYREQIKEDLSSDESS